MATGLVCAALATVSLLVLAVTGYAWSQYRSLATGMHKSSALNGEATSLNGDTNILIMGLDSRLDEDGNPLPQNIYDALHAGDSSDGGQNANVLMLLHVPADGSRATSISIPRDDYVAIPGCPDGQCHGKIKQAYGLAYDQASRKLLDQPQLSKTERVQQERDAGRRAEIDTVRQFLGGVPVDHYVEVTLVAFLQIAQVVQPITVCLTNDTQDSYSGAKFHQGTQQITAEQAVAFVRQRRDNVHPALQFTDLDRERRQQAFIASLAYQLKQAGTLADPVKLRGLLDVAKQNTAVDDGLDLLTFAGEASNLTGGNVSFVTLPIARFGTDSTGEDVNIVDLPAIQSLVRRLIGGGTAAAATTAPPTSTTAPTPTHRAVSGTVDLSNANGRTGLASEVAAALTAQGYREGTTGTSARHVAHSVVYYPRGSATAAQSLADLLGGIRTAPDSTVPSGHLRVVLGTDFSMPSSLTSTPSNSTDNSTESSGPTESTALPAAAGGDAPLTPTPTSPDPAGPAPTSVSVIGGGGVPCVK